MRQGRPSDVRVLPGGPELQESLKAAWRVLASFVVTPGGETLMETRDGSAATVSYNNEGPLWADFCHSGLGPSAQDTGHRLHHRSWPTSHRPVSGTTPSG